MRDLLRVEEILEYGSSQGAFQVAPSDTMYTHSRNIGILISTANESIVTFEEACWDNGVELDFSEANSSRRHSLPEEHPYKVILPYFTDIGVDRFADFRGYTDLLWNDDGSTTGDDEDGDEDAIDSDEDSLAMDCDDACDGESLDY
jgi:hypothetical protein